MVSSPRTTAPPTSSSTTPPLRSTASAPFRRTSGSSTPLAAARRARRRKKCTRCNTSRHKQNAGRSWEGPPRFAVPRAGGDAPRPYTSRSLGHRAFDGDQGAVGQHGPHLLGRRPGHLDAAQALVEAVAVAVEVVHG